MNITIDGIPNEVFFKAKLELDMYRAYIRKQKAIEQGLGEVELVSVLGYKANISKLDLIEDFKQLNNKRIKLLGVRCNKGILIKRNEQREMLATYIPPNCTLDLRGRSVTDVYLVCEKQRGGEPDRSNYYIVSRSVFPKAFTMQGNINKVLDEFKGVRDVNQRFISYDSDEKFEADSYEADSYDRPKVNRYKIIGKTTGIDGDVLSLKIQDKETKGIENIPYGYLVEYIERYGVDNLEVDKNTGTLVYID